MHRPRLLLALLGRTMGTVRDVGEIANKCIYRDVVALKTLWVKISATVVYHLPLCHLDGTSFQILTRGKFDASHLHRTLFCFCTVAITVKHSHNTIIPDALTQPKLSISAVQFHIIIIFSQLSNSVWRSATNNFVNNESSKNNGIQTSLLCSTPRIPNYHWRTIISGFGKSK